MAMICRRERCYAKSWCLNNHFLTVVFRQITQVYLGKVSDSEDIRWMDVLHGKEDIGFSLIGK